LGFHQALIWENPAYFLKKRKYTDRMGFHPLPDPPPRIFIGRVQSGHSKRISDPKEYPALSAHSP
jgi:hypothetical protein